MPRTARLIVLGAILLAGAAPASAGPATPQVARGYDLFSTPAGGGKLTLSTPLAGHDVMTFRGVPLGSFDFEGTGRRSTGSADTIVRRLDTATPANPKVDIELVGLLLESTSPTGYFVTPQSTRPLGLPSTGTLEFTFPSRGSLGLLRSELMVNYDIRYGSPTGPIVYTGSTGMGFVADHLIWQHAPATGDEGPGTCVASVPAYCLSAESGPGYTLVCHEAGPPAPVGHKHCVAVRTPAVPLIAGVNHKLNGKNTAADFHVLGAGEVRG